MCLFICSCSYKDNREDYNFLEDNSIRFIKNDTGIILLINKNDIFYKVILNDIDDIYYDYVIDINKTRYFCNNDIIYRRDDKIEIMMNNKKLCIYMDRYKDSDYRDCNFIYLYDINKDFYIELNDNMVLLYDSYTKFNYRFMYMLARVWIDSYTIDNDYYTTITFEGDDYTVTSYKRRGKTIHKKLIS